MFSSRSFWISLVAAGSLPSLASAGDGVLPRTPVVWIDVPCMQLIDRSQGAVWNLPYDIPQEDTDVTADEVADSRTHQFLAFCRPHDPQSPLPNWIAWADIEAAAEAGLVQVGSFSDGDVLDTTPDWADCLVRINGDDERRPITFEMAEQGVDWDTTDLTPGAYTISGYTYQPPFNLWQPRRGVVKIHDGDPDAVGPAAAITTGDQDIYDGQSVAIEGCVDAIDGATLTAYWARTSAADPQWVPFVENQLVEADNFAIDFVAPADLVGFTGMIRVDVHDPQDRSYTAYMAELITVLPGADPDSCATDGGFVGSPDCPATTGGPSTTSGSTTTTTDTSATATTQMETASRNTGCGCTTTSAPPTAALPFLTLLSLRRRRARPRRRRFARNAAPA